MIQVIEDFRNPFMDSSRELVVLSTRDCVIDEAASSVRQVEALGKLQHDEYTRAVIDVPGVSEKSIQS